MPDKPLVIHSWIEGKKKGDKCPVCGITVGKHDPRPCFDSLELARIMIRLKDAGLLKLPSFITGAVSV